MSESETETDKFAEYRSTAGAEVKTADVAGDDHPLRQELGTEDGAKERKYDAKIAGERFVQFYDECAAAIREYLSNAETACIRRARHELLDAGFSEDDIPSNVADMLEMAREECDYEPLIEITYNRKSDDTRLVIEDNGIGISVEEYQVLQRIGYSTSHGDGERLGQFGMGFMSGFQLTSIHGMFRMFTRSYLTDEAYSTAEYVANCEYLNTSPDTYGTRFEFPGFGEAAKEIDIPSKVEEYAEGMRVPVLYRDFDASGQETAKSDDFLPRNIEDDYPDDSMVVAYEDEYFKAVMSPDYPENRRSGDLVTYNVTMPIRRNLDSFTTNDRFNAPWKWDFRSKREDGPVVNCESDPSLEGKVPVENSKYDNMIEEQKDNYVPMSQVPDDAIVMPSPASSRDSFMGGYDDFWSFVSTRLNEAWAEIAAERFEDLDDWSDFKDMDREEKEALFRAYSQFGPSHKDAEPDNIQETLEDEFGVTLDTDVCEKLHASRSKVYVIREGHAKPHTKGAAYKVKIWKLLDDAPDGVYMGKSINKKKANIVWGLGDTAVVRIGDGENAKERYEELSNLWGFEKLKDIPTSDLKEKLPELDDDVAEEWEDKDVSTPSGSSGSTSRRTSRDPTTKTIRVRVGKNSRRKYSDRSVANIESALSNDDSFRAGRYSCNRLLVYDQTKTSKTPMKHADRNAGVAVTCVPKYVYNYLKDVDNVYTSHVDLREDRIQEAKDALDLADVVVIAGGDVYKKYGDEPRKMADLLNEHTDADIGDDESIAVYGTSKLKDHKQVLGGIDFDARVIAVNGGYKSREIRDEKYSLSMVNIIFDQEVPEMDHDAPEFRQIFGRKKYINAGSDQMMRGIEMVKEMGGRFPSQVSDADQQDSDC